LILLLFHCSFAATIYLTPASKSAQGDSPVKKTLAVLFAIGISVAYAASSYRVTLSKPTTINGTDLKAGDCKVEIQGDKVVIKQGKTSVESNVSVENAAQKYVITSVGYDADRANEVRDIRIGGTNVKLTFGTDAKSASAAGSK
jgi:hypothetical protein